MTSAIFIPWVNKLAEIMSQPGGVRVGEAMDRATRNLETAKASCLADMDEQLAEIEKVCAEGGRHPADDVKRRIYDLSNDVVAVAGTFELGDLGQAAFFLCELVDRLRSLDRWNQAAVEVHLSACRLLRVPDAQADRSSVLAGLRRLTENVAAIAE